MNIVLLQTKLSEEEVDALMQEFPQFLFISLAEFAYNKLDDENWGRVEVLYGPRLNTTQFKLAKELRWIHTPTPHLSRLPIPEIRERGNIIITTTKDENVEQVGEFVLGGILMYAKNFGAWNIADQVPETLWDSKWRDSMWHLKSKTLLQIGLGNTGTAIAKRCQDIGMRTWGMRWKQSFHPYCKKTFPLTELHSVLPKVDVVSIAIPRNTEPAQILGENEFSLMKDDSIIILIGDRKFINEKELVSTAKEGKFRGILIDAPHQIPIPTRSPLWDLTNIIITPDVSSRPKSRDRMSFHSFRHNLRQYVHGNYTDMENVVNFKAVQYI